MYDCLWCLIRLKELEEQYAKEKAETVQQFEKQRRVSNSLFAVPH